MAGGQPPPTACSLRFSPPRPSVNRPSARICQRRLQAATGGWAQAGHVRGQDATGGLGGHSQHGHACGECPSPRATGSNRVPCRRRSRTPLPPRRRRTATRSFGPACSSHHRVAQLHAHAARLPGVSRTENRRRPRPPAGVPPRACEWGGRGHFLARSARAASASFVLPPVAALHRRRDREPDVQARSRRHEDDGQRRLPQRDIARRLADPASPAARARVLRGNHGQGAARVAAAGCRSPNTHEHHAWSA